MAHILDRMVPCQQIPVAETTIYTSVAKTQLKQVWINNPTGGAITVGISAVQVGGAADATNRFYGDKPVAPYSVEALDLTQILRAGEFLSWKASALGVTCWISGTTF